MTCKLVVLLSMRAERHVARLASHVSHLQAQLDSSRAQIATLKQSLTAVSTEAGGVAPPAIAQSLDSPFLPLMSGRCVILTFGAPLIARVVNAAFPVAGLETN